MPYVLCYPAPMHRPLNLLTGAIMEVMYAL